MEIVARGGQMQLSKAKRKEILAVFGGANLAWPFAASGQQSAMPVIGFLIALISGRG
jgi:hypothetical protein